MPAYCIFGEFQTPADHLVRQPLAQQIKNFTLARRQFERTVFQRGRDITRQAISECLNDLLKQPLRGFGFIDEALGT